MKRFSSFTLEAVSKIEICHCEAFFAEAIFQNDRKMRSPRRFAPRDDFTQGFLKWLLMILFVGSATSLIHATTYYSQGNLAANLSLSWNTNPAGGGSSPANFTNSADLFMIQYPDSMHTTASWNVAGTVHVNAGFLTYQHNSSVGVLHVSGDVYINSGAILTVNDGNLGGDDLVIGYFNNSGFIKNSGTLSYGSGATGSLTLVGSYIHNVNGGTIPQFTWNPNSNLKISGVTTTLPTAGLAQNFGNIIYDSPSQSVNVTLTIAPLSLTNLTINSTGSGRLILGTNITPSTNVTVDGGIFDIGIFSITGASTLTVASGAILRIGGVTNFPLTFGAYAFNTASTVEYYNIGVKTIGGVTYGKLKINNSAIAGGNITVNDSLIISGGQFNTASYAVTISGVLRINSDASIDGTAPTYNSGSTLVYAIGGTFGRGVEWSATSGPGYPHHVQISNYTTVNLGANSGGATAKQIGGNLTIDDGSFLDMTINPMTAPLIVLGSMNIDGDLYLSSSSGGDAVVGGDWIKGLASNFVPNGRSVTFNGGADQTIDASLNIGEETFTALIVDKPSGNLVIDPLTNIVISGSSGDVLQINNNGGIYLNGSIFSLINSGGSIRVDGGQRMIFGTGDFQFNGSKLIASSGGGTLVFDDSIIVNVYNTIDFGAGITTVNGILKLLSSTPLVNQPPIYGPASTLTYSTGVPFGRGAEWSSTTGAGYPNNVTITGFTVLNLGANNGEAIAREIAGDLIVNGSCTLEMNASGDEMTAPVTVNGSVKNYNLIKMSSLYGNDLNIRGDLIQGDASIVANGSVVSFFGTDTSHIDGISNLDKLRINKTSGGVTLNTSVLTIDDTLFLTNGLINTGFNAVEISAGGNVMRTNGYVNGTLRHYFSVGSNVAHIFDIGDENVYAPVTVTFANVSADDYMSVSTSVFGSSLSGSLIDEAKNAERFWTVNGGGILYDSYDAIFTFDTSDVDPGADPLQFAVRRKMDTTWYDVTAGTRTDTTTQGTNIDGFGEFAVGELLSYEIISTATAGGTITPSGSTFVTINESQDYIITADPGYYIQDVTVGGSSVGAIKHYTFSSVADTHSIHVVFAPVPTPLLGEYSADPNTTLLMRFNEPSGNLVYDISGNDNPGIAAGTNIIPGRIGNAREFDGTDKYITVENDSTLDLTNTFTIEAWISIPSTTSSGVRTIVGKGRAYSMTGYSLAILPSGKLRAVLNNDTTNVTVDSDSLLLPNQWNHVAVTYDGSVMKLYINGMLNGSDLAWMHVMNSGEALVIGKEFLNSTDGFFEGALDELRISDIARTPDQFNLRLTPQNFSSFISNYHDINLSWDISEGISPIRQYFIFRGTDSTNLALYDSTTINFYTDLNIPFFSTYYYHVSVIDSAGFESDPTPFLATFVPDNESPDAPVLLSAVGSNGAINMTWSTPSFSDVNKYWVFVENNLTDSTNSFTDTMKVLTGLENLTSYWVSVIAFDSLGNQSVMSNYRTVTPHLPVYGEYVTDANTVLLLHLDETNGSRASDVSGNDNVGYYTSINATSGKFENALMVIDRNVEVSDDPTLKITNGSFTIESWIYKNNETLPFEIFRKHTGTVGYLLEMIQNDGRLRLKIQDSASNIIELIGNRFLADSSWHHTAVMYDNGMQKVSLFVDGVEDTSVSTAPLTASFDTDELFRIGPYVDGGSIIADNPREKNVRRPVPRFGTMSFQNIVAVDEVRISSILRSPAEFNLQLPPKELSAIPNGTTIDLGWQNGGGVIPLMHYIVFRGIDSTSMTPIDTTTDLFYSDMLLPIGNTYCYRISAVDSTGFESVRSFAASASSSDIIPPTTPTALAVIDSMHTIFTLRWSGSIANDFRAYLIYSGTNPLAMTLLDSTLSVTDTTKLISGLTIGTPYVFSVTAIDTNGNESGTSNFVYATPYYFYPVIASKYGNGTISPPDTISVNHGDTIAYTVIAQKFNHIDSVTIDLPGNIVFTGGTTADTLFSYSFNGVTSARSIAAYFSPNPNLPPVYTAVLPDTAIARFDTLFFQYSATDPDSGTIRYALLSAPSGASIDSLTGLLTYIPAINANGTHQYVVQLSDDSVSINDTSFVRVNIYGDVSGNGTISAFDASKVLQHVVAITLLDPLQQRIGDVSGNQTISSLDASYILQYTVGIISSFPGGLGKFTHSESILSAFSFRIEKGTQPDEYDLFVSVNKPSNVFGVAMSLKFDTATVSPVTMFSTILTDSMMMAFNFYEQFAHLALAGVKPMNDAGDIAKFTFILKEKNYPKNAVLFTMDRFILNETDHTNDVGGISLNVRGLAQLPTVYRLEQNFPNPFNPSTTINYQLPEASSVKITVYNILGQAVRTLVNENQFPGYYSLQWNGTNHDNRQVASGMYIYRIEAAGAGNKVFMQVKKMMMLK